VSAGPSKRARVAAIALGVLLVALFAIVAAAQGLGNPEPGDGEIAVVEDAPDGTITQEQLDRGVEQTAARQGLQEVPATDDPQYELLEQAAISDLLLGIWVRGEAEDRGIEVSDREIDEELQTVIEEQFGDQKGFERFLEQSSFTEEEARERIELQLISDRVQQQVLPEEPPITDDQVQAFYDENEGQFEQPETRDVRQLLTKTQAEAQDAVDQLERDDSPKTWEKLAEDVSIDEATKSTGGLREGVAQGQSEALLDQQIFAAPTDELVGPFGTDAGFYVIQVEGVTPAQTTPVSEATEQIRQQLVSARQQEIATDFQEDFVTKWSSRTYCAEGFRIDRCANADPPADPCTEELADTQGCEAPVPSTRPQQPGTTGVFGTPAPQGLPQGPITPSAEQPAGGLPPGLTPLPGGAQPGATPPGTAPQGAAPQGTAPQAAPPAAPPGG
jgi:parvulin-like peptidyl-prolyl isomerase